MVLSEFVRFIREQRVVGVATGFILAGAVSKVVSSFVQDIIQPIIGFIFGSVSGLKAYRYESLMYGNFLANLIDFVIIAAVVYFIFKRLKLDRLDVTKEEIAR
ncbi:MscL family protein [Patescibacteria group bacterium]|nr:MscL family protein [Patescibacteria group bacterium]